MILNYLLFFIVCCAALYFAGNWMISGLSRIAKFLGWKEFVVAFFVMALAATLPNLFLAIIAIMNGVPELSLGDVLGGNVVDMTLAVALAAFFARGGGIDAESRTVQTSAIFTLIAGILPLALFLDGTLARADGAILISLFCAYMYWLLSKRERFKKTYDDYDAPVQTQFGVFVKDLVKVITGMILLMVVAQGIVISAEAFSIDFDVPLSLVGILIVGLGNCFPEIYFAIASARAGETRMMLGDIMGSVVLPSTLVLGLVALVSPITIDGIAMFAAARWFLLTAAVFFFICVRTGQKITKKEALFLLSIYIAFLIIEVLAK